MVGEGRERAKQQVIDTFLASENARLRAERDEAREAAEHLWFYGEEHGVSHEEARRWYPWLYELHEQKLAAGRAKDDDPPAAAREQTT